MLYKKILFRLYKEAGINYNNIDDIKKALTICNNVKREYEDQLDSTMCYHNGILSDLLKFGVISKREYKSFYDIPSYISVLFDIDHMLFRKSEKGNYVDEIDIINHARESIHNLEEIIINDDNLKDLAKNARDNMYDELKGAIKRNKKEGKALTYQQRKLSRRK